MMKEASKIILPTPVQTPISPEEFREMASAIHGRAILLIRHAERPKIEENDPTFGEKLGLTETGIRMTQSYGERLKGIKNCSYGASPMRRTQKTARLLAAAMGVENADIFDAPEAGIYGLWVEDTERLHAGYQREGSAIATDRYFCQGHLEGYRPIQLGTRRMFKWLSQTDFGGDNAFIVSHDIFIAAFLQGLGVRSFSSKSWVGYLQGAALIETDHNEWNAFYCVPDKNNFATTFIQ